MADICSAQSPGHNVVSKHFCKPQARPRLTFVLNVEYCIQIICLFTSFHIRRWRRCWWCYYEADKQLNGDLGRPLCGTKNIFFFFFFLKRLCYTHFQVHTFIWVSL